MIFKQLDGIQYMIFFCELVCFIANDRYINHRILVPAERIHRITILKGR